MNKFIYFVILSLATLPLLWNLLKPGFYTSHDGEWMVIRLTAFHQALREGQFPVRWLPRLNHGYGYPVTNFLYPLPFYLAEPFYVVTGNPATAVQIVMGLSVVSMALGMFAFLSSLTANHQSPITGFQFSVFSFPSFVGALVYVYSPYVAYNLYQRGSLGELVALGSVPWVFWAIRTRWWPVASLLFAALITAHNVVALLFFSLVLSYIIFRTRPDFSVEKSAVTPEPRSHALRLRGRRPRAEASVLWGRPLFITLLSLSLSAFFWIPALYELRFVRASTIAISDFQNEYLSLDDALKRTGFLSTVANLGFPLYFLTDASSGFWKTFPILQVIQFPWRLLSVFSFTGAVVTAMLLSRMGNRKAVVVGLGVIVLFVSFQSSRYFYQPLTINHQPSSYYSTNDDTTTVRAEYTPIWVKDLPKERPSEPATHYYPGWRAFVDGKEAVIAHPNTTNGILKTADFIDPSRVRFLWSETPLRAISNLISLVCLFALLTWEHRRQKEDERRQRRHIRAGA